jgi:hypothetical protein
MESAAHRFGVVALPIIQQIEIGGADDIEPPLLLAKLQQPDRLSTEIDADESDRG